MKHISPLTYIKLDDLKLDFNNPRFAELYTGSDLEEDLIKYLLYEEAGEEIAKAIVRNGQFYEDKALWVIKDSDGRYLVGDGNRRCAAVKALQIPGKYGLSLPKTPYDDLPVYIYEKLEELKSRISEEHAASLFRSWERIAKALQILELANDDKNDEINLLDSKPGDFIKLGSFYEEAVKIGGEDFKKLLRRGRGKDAGKTIIFERLFKYANECGYSFKRKPSYRINILDAAQFRRYIIAVVDFLSATDETITADYIDNKANAFFESLKDYGFKRKKQDTSGTDQGSNSGEANSGTGTGAATDVAYTGSSASAGTGSGSPGAASGTGRRASTKRYPEIKRKQLPPGLKQRIDEYYKALDSSVAPNAKIAMGRVLFECVMKFVVEETAYNGKTYMYKAGYFGPVYADSKYTDFKKMRQKFIDLIKSPKERNAMISFDFEHLHQIVHNYLVNGMSTVGDQVASNLLELIEFMLQDEADLLNSLDLTKIK